MDLIADIGATNARCALLAGNGRISSSRNLLNADFRSLEDLLRSFLNAAGANPKRCALAIAAPVADDEIAMTNIGWRFRQTELRRQLGVDELTVLNDFEALAHALPRLGDADCVAVGSGRGVAGGTMAAIGPGSGLGVATCTAGQAGWVAIAGEGGHVSMPAFNETEAAILAEHGDPNGHCSAERLLSGPGLVRIYTTLSRLAERPASSITPAEVTARAGSGDEIAVQTLEVFFALLGTVAGNLALTVGARGGIFIAGGIVPRMLEDFRKSAFRERFVAKGRYRAYLDAIPTAVITIERAAFIGLRSVLGYD